MDYEASRPIRFQSMPAPPRAAQKLVDELQNICNGFLIIIRLCLFFLLYIWFLCLFTRRWFPSLFFLSIRQVRPTPHAPASSGCKDYLSRDFWVDPLYGYWFCGSSTQPVSILLYCSYRGLYFIYLYIFSGTCLGGFLM